MFENLFNQSHTQGCCEGIIHTLLSILDLSSLYPHLSTKYITFTFDGFYATNHHLRNFSLLSWTKFFNMTTEFYI